MIEDIRLRDRIDSNRCFAPLKKPSDAISIDTSNLTIEKVVDVMCQSYQKKQQAKEHKAFHGGSLFYRSVIFSYRILFKLLYRYRVFGLENYPSGAALVAANHTSFYDPPAVAIACPRSSAFYCA